jgi:hypothetical protein
MSRNRFAVLASTLVVAAGAAIAVGAVYMGNAQAAVGPLPAEALALPGDARFVLGIDVKRFVASPFYRKAVETHRESGKAGPFQELEEKTGLNPERDLESVYVAGRQPSGKDTGGGVVIVTGTFDRYKLQRSIETAGHKPTTKTIEGVTVYVHDEAKGARKAGAVGFLEDNVLVMGSLPDVEKVIAARVHGQGGVKSNATLVGLLENVRPGSTFWAVGDQSLLASMPKTAGAPGGPQVALPGLKSMLVTADLDPEINLELTGEASDEAAARNLADVVRGFVALAQLQSSQKPELKQLATAVSVTTEESRVRVSARVPYELLDALSPKKKVVVSGDASAE